MRIELTDNEQVLYKKALNIEQDYESGSEAMANLYNILKERNAIPTERLNWFVKPEWNIGTKKSRKELCTPRNGKILKQPQFLKHLKYFIEGPELPKKFLDYAINFRSNNKFDDQFCEAVLIELKRNKPKPFVSKKIAEEAFKLCSELNINIYEAKHLRQSILKLS